MGKGGAATATATRSTTAAAVVPAPAAGTCTTNTAAGRNTSSIAADPQYACGCWSQPGIIGRWLSSGGTARGLGAAFSGISPDQGAAPSPVRPASGTPCASD